MRDEQDTTSSEWQRIPIEGGQRTFERALEFQRDVARVALRTLEWQYATQRQGLELAESMLEHSIQNMDSDSGSDRESDMRQGRPETEQRNDEPTPRRRRRQSDQSAAAQWEHRRRDDRRRSEQREEASQIRDALSLPSGHHERPREQRPVRRPTDRQSSPNQPSSQPASSQRQPAEANPFFDWGDSRDDEPPTWRPGHRTDRPIPPGERPRSDAAAESGSYPEYGESRWGRQYEPGSAGEEDTSRGLSQEAHRTRDWISPESPSPSGSTRASGQVVSPQLRHRGEDTALEKSDPGDVLGRPDKTE